MLKEFRDFIVKGNVLDLAVAVILAVAFGAVLVAFTDGVLMALIAAIVNLVLVGGSLFLVVKVVNRLRKRTTAPETDRDVLVQIRDALVQRSANVSS